MSGPSGSRKCHVKKKESEEFEFFLKFDEERKGQIITSVTKDGPAYRSGLKDGDRVIAVNGNNVEEKDHGAIVAIIRECIPVNEIEFLVVDVKNDPNTPQPKAKATSGENPRPRICKIKKKDNSFGFFLEARGDPQSGHFIKKVTKGGAADGTGLRDGDRVIAVNKTNVDTEKHTQVVNLIKKSGNKVTLLVIDEEGYGILKKKKIAITEKLARGSTSSSVKASQAPAKKSTKSSSSSKAKPTKEPVKQAVKSRDHENKGKVRVVHLLKHPTKGYGFFLRAKAGAKGEYAGDIEKDGSADICGVLNDDHVVAVNGKNVMEMTHSDVIALIKTKESQVVLVVMDDVARKKFEEKEDYPNEDDIVHAHSHLIKSVKLTKTTGGFGMSLKMEKNIKQNNTMHIFNDVESGGVADAAGLKDGDILIAVEGNGVLTASHEECVKKIKEAGQSVEMIVGSRAASDLLLRTGVSINMNLVKEWPSENELSVPLEKPKQAKREEVKKAGDTKPVAATAAAVAEEVFDKDLGMKPRLCHMKRRDGGFGFFLKDDKGHYLVNVETDGPAFCAGALDYDRIVEINGHNVEKCSHSEIVQKIRESKNEVTFLVVNKEEDKFFQEKGIAITSSLLNQSDELADEHKPRRCTLIRSDKGYGFHLIAGPNKKVQLIKEVTPGGVAEIAGLRENDRIIEVNDVDVIGATHDAIVERIKHNKDQVTFLVIDKEGEAYYKMRNIVIVASLAMAKKNSEENESASIGRASASSSTIETEATVHQEDENQTEQEFGEKILEVAAEVIDDGQKESENETESMREKIEKAVEEANDTLGDAAEEKEDLEDRRELEPIEKAAVAIAAAAIVDEIKERSEEENEASDIESVVSDVIEILEEKRDEAEDKFDLPEAGTDNIRTQLEDKEDSEKEHEPEERAVAAIAAVAEIKDVIENGDARSESNDSRPPTPVPNDIEEETPYDEMHEAIQSQLDAMTEKEDEGSNDPKSAMKTAQLLINSEIAERFSQIDELSNKDDEESESEVEEPAVLATPDVIPPSPERAPSPPIEKRAPPSPKVIEMPKNTFVVVPKPVVKREEEKPKPAPIPIATILTQQKDIPKLKSPPPQPSTTKIIWGQHQLRSVNKPPVATPASPPQKEEDEGPPVMSSVRALRAALEQKNRENQQGYRKSDARNELEELTKQGGTNKHAQMFGGSAKKPQLNGSANKNKWTGEGMTIKIVET